MDPDVDDTITRSLEDCPNGYPRLAAFLASEPNFSLYRGFGYLHARVLLELQSEIVALEQELDDIDEIHSETDGSNRRLISRGADVAAADREKEERTRQDILRDIRTKLVEYDDMMIKSRELTSFQIPSQRNYRSVRAWIYNLQPLVEREQEFIKRKEDIITTRQGREWSGFDGYVESMIRRLNCKLIRHIFCTRELREKTNDKHVNYYSASRVEKFVGIIITVIILILLVLPVVALYQMTSMRKKSSTIDAVGVLIVFTLLFSAAMSLLTKARRHELFAASAAYCAVLVVFISNFGNDGPQR
ncbi:hypothetical protein P152DRAFT_395521 [Eremomyces bilateralis CBS 781.70]|uniref:DUF6594 domain-containing protein n=1 Tax=Eremomyces bilateralis CBS 781.70 TaxID=1392243 RepID=A0A6G1G639_9PEZI|nr:uncharacterized protein P152DRAFT_395521 [Eremomyces bilateralis CBS 781.70]KAF1813340.1 hypothetical protein P152DRAFT_395521 [Eremomyces bilateralis CBS 781.70]